LIAVHPSLRAGRLSTRRLALSAHDRHDGALRRIGGSYVSVGVYLLSECREHFVEPEVRALV